MKNLEDMTQAYKEGYCNGYLDAKYLDVKIKIALYSRIPSYNEGYHDGHLAGLGEKG